MTLLALDGRVAMLACLGWLVAEVVHLPNKQFSNPVALDAIYQVPVAGWVQILIAISVVELATFKMVYDPKRAAGQLGFDPLKMDSPTMRLKEVKNGRLAMIGISTLVLSERVPCLTIAGMVRIALVVCHCFHF